MNFLNNDDGVSEIIGALLIFLILVVVLGTMQVYEVPKWNKELERQHFDIVTAEFIDMKSDLEDVSSQGVPKTSSLHMGVRYPERFMLRNPGPAYGALSTYPLNITVNITLKDSVGNIKYNVTKYTSNGIEYKLNGLSNFPKLVYEHGLIIKDFGMANLTDDVQCLVNGDDIFIPILNWSSIALYSAETESFNLKPFLMSNFNTTNSTTGVEFNITRINITMDTKYNKIWNETFNDNRVRVIGNKINISIPGSISSSKKFFVYPNTSVIQTGGAVYSGMIKYSSEQTGNTYITNNNYGGGGGSPPFTNIDTSKPNWPVINNITIDKVDSTHSTITATIKNVTGPLDIHADLTSLTMESNPMMYDEHPDFSTPNSPYATSWILPNYNTVKWTNIPHKEIGNIDGITIAFFVINKNDGMQFYTYATFNRRGANNWR